MMCPEAYNIVYGFQDGVYFGANEPKDPTAAASWEWKDLIATNLTALYTVKCDVCAMLRFYRRHYIKYVDDFVVKAQ